MRYRLRAALAAALAGFCMLFFSGVAHADVSYLNEATLGLQSSPLYVSPSVYTVDAAAQSAILAQIGSADIAVAMLPAAAGTEVGADKAAFASNLAMRTGHATVILAVGNTLTVSSGGEWVQPGSSKATGNYDPVTNAVIATIGELQKKAPTADAPSRGGSGLSFAFGLLAICVIVLGALAGGLFYVRSRSGSFNVKRLRKASSRDIQMKLSEIFNMSRDVKDQEMQKILQQISIDVAVLFNQLKDETLRGDARVQYEKLLSAVVTVVASYVDICDNPRYYVDSEVKQADAVKLLTETARNILQDVRAAKSNSLKEFYTDSAVLELWQPTRRR